MQTVLVSGSSGTVGRAVAANLADARVAVLRAVRSEHPEFRSDRERALDFTDPRGWSAAVKGVDSVFLMRPPAIADMESTLIPFIDTALAGGVKHIVFLSLQGVQFNAKTPHHAVEKHLVDIGAPYTFLRPNFFMQNLADMYGEEIRSTSEIRVPAGRAFTAFIDARDIGRVASQVLTEKTHHRRAYTLSGEQTLSYHGVAKIMTEELGRPITYTRPSPAEYAASLAAGGYPDDFIEVQKMIYRVVRLNVSAAPNRRVRQLTARPATSFRQFVRDYSDTWSNDPV